MTRRAFVMVPTELLHSDVSGDAIRLWAVVDDLVRQEQAAAVSQAALAAAARIGSDRRLRRLLAELVDAGWLEVMRRGPKAAAYVPLGRARRPQPPLPAVENLRGRVDAGVRSFTLKSGRWCPVNRPGFLLPAREEEEGRVLAATTDGGGAAARRPPWCGGCHEPTRLVDAADGRAARCPACHPLEAARF